MNPVHVEAVRNIKSAVRWQINANIYIYTTNN